MADSGLLAKLNNFSFDQYNQPLCLYRDPVCLLRVHLQGAFKNKTAGLTPELPNYNKVMTQERTSAK